MFVRYFHSFTGHDLYLDWQPDGELSFAHIPDPDIDPFSLDNLIMQALHAHPVITTRGLADDDLIRVALRRLARRGGVVGDETGEVWRRANS